MSIFNRDTPRFRVKTQRVIQHSPIKIIERYLIEKEKEKEENKENYQENGFFLSDLGAKGFRPDRKLTKKPADNLWKYKNKHNSRYSRVDVKKKGKSEKSFRNLNKIVRDSKTPSKNKLKSTKSNNTL